MVSQVNKKNAVNFLRSQSVKSLATALFSTKSVHKLMATTLIAVGMTLGTSITAEAIVFNLDEDTLGMDDLLETQPTNLLVDGIGLTITFSSDQSSLQVDSDGIFLQRTNTVLNFVFDTPVNFTDYTIGFNNSGVTGFIDFTTSGGGSSLMEPGITSGSYTLGTPLFLNAGEVLTVDANVNNVSQLFSIEVTEPDPVATPEPASILGLLAFGAMGAGSMLKRKQKSYIMSG